MLFPSAGEVTDSASKLSRLPSIGSATANDRAASQTRPIWKSWRAAPLRSQEVVDRVRRQAWGRVRSNLELAQTELRASVIAPWLWFARVNEIQGILSSINDIADQTNLLASTPQLRPHVQGTLGRFRVLPMKSAALAGTQ